MIVGCYALDLYCDSLECLSHDFLGNKKRGQAQFTGPNGRAAKKEAREHGWTFFIGSSVSNDKCYCPACTSVRRAKK